VWLIGAVVCLLAANRGSNCSLTRAMDGCIVHCGVISSCQSAATHKIVKRFWLRTHVRSATTNITTVTFTFKSAGWPALLTASAFNGLGQCSSSPGNTAYCYHSELTVSSLAVSVTIASAQSGTHSHLAFATLPLPIPFIAFLKLTASSRPSAPASDSPKCLRFGHWLTLCTLNIH